MKFVNKLEHKFEEYFDGFFYKNLSNISKLKKIAGALRECMKKESMTEGGAVYAPDDYEVYLNLQDYKKLKINSKNNFNDYFEKYLINQAELRGYIFLSSLRVRLIFDETPAKPGIKIIAKFRHGKSLSQASCINNNIEPAADGKEGAKKEETRVFEKIDLKTSAPPKLDKSLAAITVRSGPDEGMKTKVTDARVNIGRRPSNEMVLSDKNTSRLHAYIVTEKGCHVIYDAQSLNGTYVNGKRIIQKKLTDSDEIKIGNTVILYKVNT